MARQLHLNLFIHGRGHHEAAWRSPTASPRALTDIRYYTDLAQKAEAGLFDSVFLADTLAVGDDAPRAPRTWLEPVTVLAALAGVTSRIGLIATCSTTYTEPFNLARQFASLDHISGGRVGWNIVTTWLATASGNYGGQGPLSHADRYERAEEYMRVVKGLWDSWSDDAVLDDRVSGQYARPDGIRALNHAGTHYQVTGPLNMPRGPQGRPVFVQAGSSDTGRRFAARHAEAVFTAQMEKATARDFYGELKALAAAEGRSAEQVLILPGLSPVIGATEAEAQRTARELNDLSDPEVGRKRLSGRFGGHDLSHLQLDEPLSPEDFPDPGLGGSRAQPDRGDHRSGAPGKADTATTAGLHGRCARAFRDRRRTGTDRRSDRGLVPRRRRGWLQPDAAGVARDAGRVHCRGGADAAKARAVPYRLCGRDAQGTLRAGAAGCRILITRHGSFGRLWPRTQ